MKSDLYKVIENPHGGWSVKELGKEGIVKTFPSKEQAESFLREIAKEEPKQTPVVMEISPEDK